MAIRQITSRSIKDNEIVSSDLSTSLALGAGAFQGENNNGNLTGDVTNGKKDIFRINEQTLNTSVTIASGDNASCAGPLTVSTSGTVNLTVNGNLTIV